MDDKIEIISDDVIDCPISTEIPIKYHNLVLSGGSVKGISQIGALKKLIEANVLDFTKLKAVAGSSAGSMLSILIVLGYDIDEIWDFMLYLDLAGMVNPDCCMLIQQLGMDDGKIIHNFFEDILAKKTGIKNINFEQLYHITKIHLTITGSCLTTKNVAYFDHINNPTLQVALAIRISISMPGFFTPIYYNDKIYIDGALLNEYPMNVFTHDLDHTIGISIRNNFVTTFNYPEEYCMSIINLFLYNFYRKSRKYETNTVVIPIIKDQTNVNIFNFSVDYETKLHLYNIGYLASTDFLNKNN